MLRSARLELEPLRVEHAVELAVLLADPELHRFTGGRPATPEQLRARFARQVAGHSPDGARRWRNWVVRRRAGGAAAGLVQATIDDHAACAELAWTIAPPWQRRGYASEAMRIVLGWLGGEGIVTVIAHIHPAHDASQAVARALGLAPTGTVCDGEVRWMGRTPPDARGHSADDNPQPMMIRDARAQDWDAIWPFVEQIVRAGETYAYDRDMTEPAARRIWMVGAPGRTVVLCEGDGDDGERVDGDGAIRASAAMYPNRAGGGAHVASASFMVDPGYAGRGAGRALGEHVLERARRDGYRAIQFNAVVETNAPAVALWRSLGFTVLGAVPEGFHHPVHGYVDLLIMHRFL